MRPARSVTITATCKRSSSSVADTGSASSGRPSVISPPSPGDPASPRHHATGISVRTKCPAAYESSASSPDTNGGAVRQLQNRDEPVLGGAHLHGADAVGPVANVDAKQRLHGHDLGAEDMTQIVDRMRGPRADPSASERALEQPTVWAQRHTCT